MNLHNVYCKALRNVTDKLSNKQLKVVSTAEHIVDRCFERGIEVTYAALLFKNIVESSRLCIDLYEAALSGGNKNFKVCINGVKVFYSISIKSDVYQLHFRTVAIKGED